MFANKKFVAVMLLTICTLSKAQTIEELSDLNRRQMISDAKDKLEKKKEAGFAGNSAGNLSAPVNSAPSGAATNNPAALSGAPVSSTLRRTSARQNLAAPVLVAIYGVGGQLVTELSDSGFEAKYRQGDRTPSGWTVARIDKRMVTLSTMHEKGKGSRTVSLPFGIKMDEPQAREKEITAAPGGLSMPPLPPNFSALIR